MSNLVLFDIDNTLLSGNTLHAKAFEVAFKDVFNVKATIDEINHHGSTDQLIIREVLQLHDVADETITHNMQTCMRRMERYFDEHIDEFDSHLFPQVEEWLNLLDDTGMYMGLVTGNLERIARAKLAKVGMGDYFGPGGFGSDHTSRTEMVKLAVERTVEAHDLEETPRTFLFGDTPKDILAGREAGVETIGMTSGAYDTEQLKDAGADHIFPDFSDTISILDSLKV